MEKVLVSACLLGSKVRYNGQNLLCESDKLKQWYQEGRIVSICPEVSGGLSVPRPPAEIVGGCGDDVLTHQAKVVDNTGQDISGKFIEGARNASKLCHQYQIRVAILTESSPSCGSNSIYSGDFSKTKISGVGVTAALLRQHGVKVVNQYNIQMAADILAAPAPSENI